jgi:serine/threonine protein kinase
MKLIITLYNSNSQYVPPELSINIEYNSDLADIWVLGIFLYRMLVGKYPFSAENDQQLFKKMLRGNFSIPPELSEDARDLLRRMLAPDMTRASLDLVIYHPWIKSYRPLLLDQYYTTSKATSSLTPKNEYFTNTTPQQQRNTTTRRSNSVHTTTPPQDQTKIEPIPKPRKKSSSRFIKKAFLLLLQGPFPPPKKPYRDLSHLGTRDSVFARQQQKV